MAFWGCEVKPGGKPTPFVPPPEGSKLHLSQACLSTKAKPGAKAALRVRVTEEGEPLALCVLREGATECLGLDLIFDSYTEFIVEGTAPIHLTGYFMPEYEMGHDDDSEDDEGTFPGGQILGYDEYGMPVMADEYDSEEDSDYETQESDEDDEMEEGDEDEDGDLNPPRRVVIEDVTDKEGRQQGGKQRPALPAPAANGKAAAFGDDDVSASDDDEEGESSEEEEGSEEEGGSSEEEEESDEEPQQAKQAAQQAQQAGQKRKAEQQPGSAKQPPKKEAKPVAATPAAAKTPKQGQQQQQQAGAAAPASQQKQQQKQQPGQQQGQQTPGSAKPKVRTFPNGFEIADLKMGRPDGKLAKPGKKVLVRYVGKLKSNGKVFDQTKGNATFTFRLGVGEVIKGWDRGVEGMRVGDKRRLTVPPQMAYGTSGIKGVIPPNSTLSFEVELVDVK